MSDEQVAPAADDPVVDDAGTPETPAGDAGTEAPAEPSGLEKALAAERKMRKDAEAQIKAFKSEEDRRRLESMSETDRAIAEAKAAGRAEAETEYQKQLLAARVVGAAAAANFHDPALAMSLLAVASDASDKEVADALAALAVERPYLVKTAGTPPMAQGPRGGGMAPTPDDWLRQAANARR